LAYESSETGRAEVYVQPFPPNGTKTQVSVSGGIDVRWARDGRELFFVAPDGMLTAVSVRAQGASDTLHIGSPSPLFPGRMPRLGGPNQQYAVARDGRFLMNVIADDDAPPIRVAQNWSARLRE
jgi:hypothetical protein